MAFDEETDPPRPPAELPDEPELPEFEPLDPDPDPELAEPELPDPEVPDPELPDPVLPDDPLPLEVELLEPEVSATRLIKTSRDAELMLIRPSIKVSSVNESLSMIKGRLCARTSVGVACQGLESVV
jgi:hypothetical protein